jgi:hypothetical protein
MGSFTHLAPNIFIIEIAGLHIKITYHHMSQENLENPKNRVIVQTTINGRLISFHCISWTLTFSLEESLLMGELNDLQWHPLEMSNPKPGLF